MVRINKGRQKIEMKKMAKESNLQVTFSKRRFGLFKKASELCTLCGAEVLMIVFSPGGKAFSFGHPNVDDMIYRFKNYNHNIPFPHPNNLQPADMRPAEHIQDLNKELTEVLEIQENEKSKRKILNSLRESQESNGIWYEDVEKLDLNQTNYVIYALENLKEKLASEISPYPQMNFYHNCVGENFGDITQGLIGDGNNEVGLDAFDERRMLDLNAFTNDPNYRSSVGSYANEVIVPKNNINYMSSNNINQN